MQTTIVTLIILYAIALAIIVGCTSTALTKSEMQNAAIVAGCTEALALARDAGEAGAADEIKTGCKASLRLWEFAK